MSNCIKCQNSSNFLCSKCFDPYCSVVCQANDWYNHKKICAPMPDLIPMEALLCAVDLKDNRNGESGGGKVMPSHDVAKSAGAEEVPKKIQPVIPSKASQAIASKSSSSSINVLNDENVNKAAAKAVETVEKNISPDVVKEPPKSSSSSITSVLRPKIRKPQYILSNLKIIPIREGKNVKLLVTDSSMLNQFVIAALDYENNLRNEMNRNLIKLAEYCKTAEKDNAGYSPHIDEICLAVFADDGDWYRSVVLEIGKSGKYTVQFIDYGNIAEVTTDKMMPITEELMFPTCTNQCLIHIVDKSVVPKIKEYIDNNALVKCNVKFNGVFNMYEITFVNFMDMIK